jgi:hypothetical protein
MRRNELSDQQLLDILDLRTKGKTTGEIGSIMGLRPERIRVASNRVKSDDVIFSHPNETKRKVLAGYWPGKSGPEKVVA